MPQHRARTSVPRAAWRPYRYRCGAAADRACILFLILFGGVEIAQMGQLLSDLRFQSSVGRFVPPHRGHALGKVVLARGVSVRLVVRVPVVLAESELLHEPGRCVAQMLWHRTAFVSRDKTARLIIRG